MIRFRKNDPVARLRANRTYLLIIIICGFLFFVFNLISLNEQRIKLKNLSSINLENAADQIARDLKNKIDLRVTGCLRQVLQRIDFKPGDENSLEALHSLRKQLDFVKSSNPIAKHFFIFSRNQIVFPRISFPPPQKDLILSPQGQSEHSRNYLRLIRQAENKEMRMNRPDEAAKLYGIAEGLPVSPRLKALALFRKAGALDKAGQADAANQAYRALLETYGDQYDESQTPYALLLANSEHLSSRIFKQRQEELRTVYHRLLDGNWELSADQAEFYLKKLEKSTGLSADSRNGSDFWEHLRLARAVSREWITPGSPPPYEVTSKAFIEQNIPRLTYRILSPQRNGTDLMVGFSLSLFYITDHLLPAYSEDPGFEDIGTVSLEMKEEISRRELLQEGNVIAIHEVIPFYGLRVSAESFKRGILEAHREVWIMGFASVMFLCVLGICIYMLINVSADIRWFRQRSDFISGVSHEFKTPLSLIRLYSETLANDDGDFSSEERKNYIRIITRESERMSRLINNVLDFTRMEQGISSRVLEEGDLSQTVMQTIADYSDYLGWRGFSLKTSIAPNLPPVRFNSEQVSQILLNLLDNARKYSGQSRLIRVNAWAQDNEVVVEVQDYGLGIPADEREKIFEPFYRAPRGNEKGGCGLGLFLVDQVMKEHGGRVEVESEVNRGSRFRLFFPVAGARKTVRQPEKNKLMRFRSRQEA